MSLVVSAADRRAEELAAAMQLARKVENKTDQARLGRELNAYAKAAQVKAHVGAARAMYLAALKRSVGAEALDFDTVEKTVARCTDELVLGDAGMHYRFVHDAGVEIKAATENAPRCELVLSAKDWIDCAEGSTSCYVAVFDQLVRDAGELNHRLAVGPQL